MPRNATIVAQKSDRCFDQRRIDLIDVWSMLDRRFFINKHFDAIQTLLVSSFIVTFIVTIIVTSTWIANQQTNLFGSNKSSHKLNSERLKVHLKVATMSTAGKGSNATTPKKWSSKSPTGQFLRMLVETNQIERNCGAAALKKSYDMFKEIPVPMLNSALQTARNAVKRTAEACIRVGNYVEKKLFST